MLFDQNFRRLGQRGRGGGTLGLQQSSLELERRASILLPLRKPEGPGALETLWVRWLQGEEDQSLQEAVLVCIQFQVQELLETSRRAQELRITRLSALSWRSMIEAAHLVVLLSGTAVFTVNKVYVCDGCRAQNAFVCNAPSLRECVLTYVIRQSLRLCVPVPLLNQLCALVGSED